MIIKTRFAPSPTGSLHIGSVRTALYAWLFAKNQKGKFILRIEDTDVQRSANIFTSEIIDSLKWLGLYWDEGPYFQSTRIEYYKSIISMMVRSGLAYKCYCTHDRLSNLRKRQISSGLKPRYDRRCRNISKKDFLNSSYTIRFQNPDFGYVSFYDKIRGVISFNNEELDDLVIQRANGMPTYNFCVVIDDRDTNITHIVRGEDHISNTPRQINILNALGADIPTYAHVSMILSDDKKKLSKRNTSITSIAEYRAQGYLPESLLNYIVRLGWSHGDQEIFNMNEMIKYFSLEGVSKSSSCLNEKKLLWLNRFYIKNLPEKIIRKYLEDQFNRNNINYKNKLDLFKLVKLLGMRCSTLQEIVENSRYFYEKSIFLNEEIISKYLTFSSKLILENIYSKLLNIKFWTKEEIRSIFYSSVNELGVSFRQLAMVVRVAITGNTVSPSICIVVYYVGKDISLFRVKSALLHIKK